LAIEAALGRSWGEPQIQWEEAFARQLHNREEGKKFTTWKEEIFPELLPKILPIAAVMEDIFDGCEDLLIIVDNAWKKVQQTWTDHVWQTADVSLSNDIVNVPSNASEPCNLLGSTAKQWLDEILGSFGSWQQLQPKLCASRRRRLEKMMCAWESVYNTFHNWDFESAIAFITWQISTDMYLNGTKVLRKSNVR
jgi:hypothetical protein